ncbi:M14 family metallocarboxypeptidase [Brevibacillus choshinensis]|uniref:M14 family metallopeptidase n=1 Tax=Brevibacillus choshinensis TaxID=54911 RepID=UPI002E1E7266|nr:M14 family metallocarboxypeptidase [Brevibacillus choshinensis]
MDKKIGYTISTTALLVLSLLAGGSSWHAPLLVNPASAAEAKEEKPFVPYYGYGPSYVQPAAIKELFPTPDIDFGTPGFQNDKVAFTSQEEMVTYITKLVKGNKHAKLVYIGTSLEGREIPLLIFSKDPDRVKADKEKPLIWLQAQIHGNEPAAGESALVIAKWLTEEKLGTDLLDKVNVIVVPRINPDGSYAFKRYIGTDLDANRDYMKVEYPEVQAIHRAIGEYEPDVVLDAHEYGVNYSQFANVGEKGANSSYDVLISSAKNLNIPESLRKMSDQLLLPEVEKALDQEKLAHHPYFTLAKTKEGKVIATEGSTETRIGRNALGLKNTLTYLVETRGIGIGRADFERRVYSQVITHATFIQSTAAHAVEIKAAVAQARQEITEKGSKANDNDKIIVVSENKLVPDQKLVVVDLAEAKRVDAPIDWVSSTDAYPVLERERPTAYIMPPGYHDIAKKLEQLGVEISTLSKETTVTVESYTVADNKVNTTYENGHFTNEVTTNVEKKTKTFPAGSYVFHMGQPNANFIALAMEPESMDSYVTFNFIPVEKGDEVPVYRYMLEKSLPVRAK